MEKFWKRALITTGIGAVGFFVFFTLYMEWLNMDIFATLSEKSTFWLMIVFLVVTLCALLSALVTFVLGRRKEKGSINLKVGDGSVGVISSGDSAQIRINN